MDRRQFHKTVLVGAAAALGMPGASSPAGTLPVPLPPHPGDVLPDGAAARLGTTRFWHYAERGNEGVNALAFSPDGRTLAALGYQDGCVSLWEVPSGRMLRKWEGDDADRCGEIAFSPCGRLLAVASNDGLRLWDPATGQFVRQLVKAHCSVHGVAFSPDGRLLAGALWLTGEAVVWEVDTGKQVARFEADPHPLWPDDYMHTRSDLFRSVAFSPDGKWLAVAATQRICHDPYGPEAGAIAQRARGKSYPAGSYEGRGEKNCLYDSCGRVWCWDLASGTRLAQLEGHEFGVGTVRFLADGRLLSCADDGQAWLWNVPSGTRLAELASSAQSWALTSIAVTIDGCHAVLSRPDSLTLVNLVSGSEVRELPVGPGWHGWRHLAISADARWIVADFQGRFQLWDAATRADVSPPGRHTTSSLYEIHFTSDGRLISSTLVDAILWGAGGECLRQVPLGHLVVGTLASSPDGRRAACGRKLYTGRSTPIKDQLLTWDWSGGEVRVWDGIEATALAWSADGESLLVVVKGEFLEIMDLLTGQRERRWEGLTGVRALTLSPDGRLVAALDDQRGVHVGELAGGERHRLTLPASRRKKHPSLTGGPLCFSPDGRSLAVFTEHGDVCLGPVNGRKLPVAFTPPPANEIFTSATALGFLPTGRLLLARSYHAGGEEEAGSDTIRVYDVVDRREVWASPPLTRAVCALAFSVDGLTLASGLSDATTLLWPSVAS
jgi:WD40 repeat protein